MGRLPATDASGQVGLRRKRAELEPTEGPVNRAERERDRTEQGSEECGWGEAWGLG